MHHEARSSGRMGPKSSARPAFTRTSSNSSTKSQDSVLDAFKGLSVDGHKEEGKEGKVGKENTASSSSPRSVAPGNSATSSSSQRSFFDDGNTTPGRKRSQPIVIELPGRDTRSAYTPLSARGDLPGGYFPNHEEINRSYKPHPFSSQNKYDTSSDLDSPSDMTGHALGSPVSETTPRGPTSFMSTGFAPEKLMMPMGKYYPSNFKSASSSEVTTPTGFANVTNPLPSTQLTIPKSTNKRGTTSRAGHERNDSDVKRKIQQYQRDMIAQAQIATVSSGMRLSKPISPRLIPAGSPGPITPFELEESAGYVVAGSRNGGSSVVSGTEGEGTTFGYCG